MRGRLASLMLIGLILLCLSRAATNDATQDLSTVLEPIRLKHNLPALAAAIVTSERTVAVGVVGVRKYGSDVPVTLNDQFHLGSDTKSMTATLIAMLVEEGKLSWNTTLQQGFPSLGEKMHPAYRRVTLEQLLAHRAGFSAQSWPQGKSLVEMHQFPGTPREQRRAYIEMILSEPPEAEPGSKYIYSNRSYAVAGALAEHAANASWEELMKQRLFQPLGMTTCGFGAMGTFGRIDQPWQHTLVGTEHRPVEPGPLSDNPAVIAPAGRVHCSVPDWAKYVRAHLQGEKGKPGLLKPETFKRLHTATFSGEYAFGWIVTERKWAGGRVLTHAGSNTMNYAIVWLAPQRDFAVLVTSNQGGTEALQACDETVATLIELRKDLR